MNKEQELYLLPNPIHHRHHNYPTGAEVSIVITHLSTSPNAGQHQSIFCTDNTSPYSAPTTPVHILHRQHQSIFCTDNTSLYSAPANTSLYHSLIYLSKCRTTSVYSAPTTPVHILHRQHQSIFCTDNISLYSAPANISLYPVPANTRLYFAPIKISLYPAPSNIRLYLAPA